jgi:hypothetical protein
VRSSARGGKCTWIRDDSTPAEYVSLGLVWGVRRININLGGNFLSSIHRWGGRRININSGGDFLFSIHCWGARWININSGANFLFSIHRWGARRININSGPNFLFSIHRWGACRININCSGGNISPTAAFRKLEITINVHLCALDAFFGRLI